MVNFISRYRVFYLKIFKLHEEIVYSNNVQPVTLPEQDEKPPTGDLAVVSGWGLDEVITYKAFG